MAGMNDSRKDAPLLEGGQGRSGADLEAEAVALSWSALILVVITGALTAWVACS